MKSQIYSMLLFSAIMLFGNPVILAQNSSSKNIVICGKMNISKMITKGKIPDVLVINNYQDPSANVDETEFYQIKLMKDSFYVSIPTKEDIRYLGFRSIWPFKNSPARYLFARGDSIHIKTDNLNSYVLSGRGSVKITYQLKLDSVLKGRKQVANSDTLNYPELEALYGNEALQSGLSLLKDFKITLSTNVYNLLSLNLLTRTSLSTYLSLYNVKPSWNRGVKKSSVILDSIVNEKRFLVDDIYWLRGDKYLATIGYLYIAYCSSQDSLSRVKESPYISAYQYVRKHHNGVLGDRLAAYLLKYSLQRDPNTLGYFQDFLDHAQDSVSKNIVSALYEANKPNKRAAELDLEDINGRRYQLKDFKGKKIVLKFWFNGCSGCAAIKGNMAQVEKAFTRKDNIAFLNVNVDKLKSRWISGLETKKYSNEREINLYTSGFGFSHPLLKYYQFEKYPQLLIISGNGSVVSSNPPIPFEKKNIAELIKILRD